MEDLTDWLINREESIKTEKKIAIENLIEELTKVRPEMLNEEALKLFNTIMAILDERDNLKKETESDKDKLEHAYKEIKRLDKEICYLQDEVSFYKKELGECYRLSEEKDRRIKELEAR